MTHWRHNDGAATNRSKMTQQPENVPSPRMRALRDFSTTKPIIRPCDPHRPRQKSGQEMQRNRWSRYLNPLRWGSLEQIAELLA